MIGWHKRRRRVAPFVIGSLFCSVTIGAAAVLPDAAWAATAQNFEPSIRADARAQTDDQPSMTQVGEGETGDTETLDEGAPPAAGATTSGDDVETLDQGAPPASAPAAAPAAAPAPAPVAAAPAAPATTSAAPPATMPSGPVLPPGFGTGRVHVSSGRFGFPVGLEACHVGAVTGRAYVGLDCGDGDDVVGHARSFDDFPFVPEVDFPFEGDEAFFSNSGVFAKDDIGSEDDVIVSAGRSSGNTADDTSRNSNSTSSNNTSSNDGSVSKAQRTRQREPRVRETKTQSSQETSQATQAQNASKKAKKNSSTSSGNDQVSQAAKADRPRHKSAEKAQHAGKQHKAKGGKGKKHDRHGKGRGRKKR